MANAFGQFDVFVRPGKEKYRIYWKDTPLPGTNISDINFQVKYYSPGKTTTSTLKNLYIAATGSEHTYRRMDKGYIKGTGWTPVLMNETIRFMHDSNGKKTITVTFKGDVGETYNGKYYSQVQSGAIKIELTPITAKPATFTLEYPERNIGETQTVHITKHSEGRSEVKAILSLGNYSKTMFDIESGNDTFDRSFVVPEDIQPYIVGRYADVTLTLKTYVGYNYLDSVSQNFRVYVGDAGKPDIDDSAISITVDPTSEVTDLFLQGKSKARISIDDTAFATGASLQSYKIIINNGNEITTSKNVYTTDVLKISGVNTVRVRAIDTRGYVSDEVSKTFNVAPYYAPIIKTASAVAHDGVSVNPDGDKIKVTATWDMASANGTNSTQVKVYVKDSDSSSFGDPVIDEAMSTLDRVLPNTYTNPIGKNVKIVVTDTYHGEASYTVTVGTSEGGGSTDDALIDISPYGVALGKTFSGKSKQFQCLPPAYFDNQIFSNGSPVTSDARVKTLHGLCPEELYDLWNDIQIHLFTYNNNPDKYQLGVVAQELIILFEKYGLEWTDYSLVIEADGRYFVDYNFINMLTLLITQQHESRLSALEEEIKKLSK